MRLNAIVISVFASLTFGSAASDAQIPGTPTAATGTDQQSAIDPVASAQAILLKADEASQCRFAFTQKTVVGARVDARFIREGKSAGESEVRFDPRRPIGSRFMVVSANSQQKELQKNLTASDKQGFPTDLFVLLPEGEFRITALAWKPSPPNATLYSFTPDAILARGSTPANAKILGQFEGELEVDLTTGRVSKIMVRTPEEGVKVGRAKLKSMLERDFALVDGRFTLTERVVKSEAATAMLSATAALNVATLFGDIEPICDPAEVANIVAAESAVKKRK